MVGLSHDVTAGARVGRVSVVMALVATLSVGLVPLTAAPAEAATLSGLTDEASPASIAPGQTSQLTAEAPAVGGSGSATPMTTTLVQQIDPTVTKLTGPTDVVAPTGWTTSYSTDGTTFTATQPGTAAAWSAVRAVKSTGSITSEGTQTNADGSVDQLASSTGTAPATAPIPPATFPASGTGDGWMAFFDPGRTRVFNVFHHAGSGLPKLDCHVIATGATCSGFPLTGNWTSQYHSQGMVVKDKIWISTVVNNYAGFACYDISAVLASGGAPQACAVPWVPLSNVSTNGQIWEIFALFDSTSGGSWTRGSTTDVRLYGINGIDGNLLCLDTATGARCADSPLAGWNVDNWTFARSQDFAIHETLFWDGRLYLHTGGYGASAAANAYSYVICVLASNPNTLCPGWTRNAAASWQTRLLKLPAANGGIAAVCQVGDQAQYDRCWNAAGVSSAPPSSFKYFQPYTAGGTTTGMSYFGDPVTHGSRIVWSNGSYPLGFGRGIVSCWDAALNAGAGGSCTPSSVTGINVGQLYSATPDPVYPDCLYVVQDATPVLRSFSLATGAAGCTDSSPTTATFNGSALLPPMGCTPSSVKSWSRLTLTTPTTGFTSARLTVRKADGSVVVSGGTTWSNIPIPLTAANGLPALTVSLANLGIADSGLDPKFEVQLFGASGVTQMSLKVTAVGPPPSLCIQVTAIAKCPVTKAGVALDPLPAWTPVTRATGSTMYSDATVDDFAAATASLTVSAPPAASCAGALQGTALIQGTAIPVAGATVSLLDASGKPVLDGSGNPVTAVTDANGFYSFPSLFAGPYTVAFGDVATADPTATSAAGITGTVAVGPTPTVVDGTYVPGPPVADPKTSIGTAGATQTLTPTATLAPNATWPGGSLDGADMCLFTPGTSTCDADGIVTVPGEGTYTLNPDGTVSFQPLPTFLGTATPLTYQVTDAFGGKATATLTPTVVAAPVANPDTSTGAWDQDQTLSPLANDVGQPGTTLDPTTLKLCGISPAQVAPNCTLTTLTVPGEGTYTVNPDGTVTFNPLSSFTGTATPIGYQVADTLGGVASSAMTPTVTPPAPPTAQDETLFLAPGADGTFTNLLTGPGALGQPGGAPLVSVCLLVPGSSPPTCDADGRVTIPSDGRYTLDTDPNSPTYGSVLFHPLGNLDAPTPVQYMVTDAAGQTAIGTLRVYYPALPVANPDTSTGPWDTVQTLPILGNDVADPTLNLDPSSVRLCSAGQTAPGCTATTLTVPGEGTYTVNPNGTVSFDPLPTFTGTATPVGYQVADTAGQVASSTLTPTVLPAEPPTAGDATEPVLPGDSVAFPAILGPGGLGQPGTPALASACLVDPGTGLCDPDNSVAIPGVGTWTLDPVTGVPTFAADPGVDPGSYPIDYRVTDASGATATGTLTAVVPAPPTANPDTSIGQQGAPQTLFPAGNDAGTDAPLVPTSIRLCAAGESAPDCTATSVTVDGEGTYTVNPDGTVTFAPEPSFTGVATPLPYVIADENGLKASSTLTPEVIADPIPQAVTDLASGPYGATLTFTPLSNDAESAPPADTETLAYSTPAWVPGSLKLCGTGESAPNCTAASVTTPDGTYTVNPDDTVTFTPAPGFTGTATVPVTYQVSDAYTVTDSTDPGNPVTTDKTGTASAQLIPTIGPPPPPPAPTAVDDSAVTGPQSPVTLDLLANDAPGDPANPLLDSSVRLCDPNTTPPQTAPNCTATSVTTPDGTWVVDPTTGTVTFTPKAGFSGTTSLPYVVADTLGQIADAVASVTVSPAVLPTANPDATTTQPDTTVTLDPLGDGGDGGVDTPGSFALDPTSVRLCGPTELGTSCSLTSLTVPGVGVWTVDPATGLVDFDPEPTFAGTASVPYAVTDEGGYKAASTLTVTVPPPTPPVASPDIASGPYGEPVPLPGILDNDTTGTYPLDPSTTCLLVSGSCDGDGTVVTPQGTWVLDPATGDAVFTPAPGWWGTTTIPYQVADDHGNVTTSYLQVTIDPPVPPTANPDRDATPVDTPITIDPVAGLNGADATGTPDDPGTFDLVPATLRLCGPGESGATCSQTTVAVDGVGVWQVDPATGAVTFTPCSAAIALGGTCAVDGDGNPIPFIGTASIGYTVWDDGGLSASSTITIDVKGGGAPVAVDDYASGPAAQPITLDIVGNDLPGLSDVLDPASIMPLDPATVRLCDPNTTPAQAAPNCTALSAVDPGKGVWSLVLDDNGDPTGEAVFTPCSAAGVPDESCTGLWWGTATLPYQIADSQGNIADALITIDIPEPLPPVANDDAATGVPGQPLVIDPLAGVTVPDDPDAAAQSTGDPDEPGSFLLDGTTIRICNPDGSSCGTDDVVVPGEGTWSLVLDGDGVPTGKVVFTPLPGFDNATTTPLPYKVKDLYGQQAEAVITITFGAPEPPAATDDWATTSAGVPVTLDPPLNDEPGSYPLDPRTVRICNPDGSSCGTDDVVVPGEGTWRVDPNTGAVTFSPEPSFSGTATIPYTIADVDGNITEATLNVIVVPFAPSAIDDATTTPIDTPVTIDPRINDDKGTYNLDATTLRLCGPGENEPNCTQTTVTTDQGTWTVDPATGRVVFAPAPGFTGTASIGYAIFDTAGQGTGATIRVTITPAGSSVTPTDPPVDVIVAPVARDDDYVIESGGRVISSAATNDAYPAGSRFEQLSQPTHGRVVFRADGSFVYVPDPGFTGTDSFRYEVCLPAPNGSVCSSAVVTITVLKPGSIPQPVAKPLAVSLPAVTAARPRPVAVFRPMSAVAVPAGCPVNPTTVQIARRHTGDWGSRVDIAGKGMWKVKRSGKVTFTPDLDFAKTSKVKYRVRDCSGRWVGSTLKVTAPGDVPGDINGGIVNRFRWRAPALDG